MAVGNGSVSAACTQSFNKILNNTEAVLLTSGLWQSALGRKKTRLRFRECFQKYFVVHST